MSLKELVLGYLGSVEAVLFSVNREPRCVARYIEVS